VLANAYTYDSYGRLTATTGAVTNPFQYTGREFDNETGNYYYRARYYDENAGRFISEDPWRGSLQKNRYRYAVNNPVMVSDWSGLKETCHLAGNWQIPWFDSVMREFPGQWRYVGLGQVEDPEEFVPTASLTCIWERSYARSVWGNALRVLKYECTETNECGLPPRLRIHLQFNKEHWFKSQTSEIERAGTGPFAVLGATDEIYELQCLGFGPPR
jgi:RHS repeat-associated protein